ncbi:hypothetical protein BB561_005038 [Smittium simulii]|uniref:Transcription regulator Rua1 C-terminal domain-containing protein n=1 Tax=Smittium simulii TaxID=133385 RepID=A0A2T9YCL0_9FUNG|nr:hypothetical protein BB561_005038 [Smittium simulii]
MNYNNAFTFNGSSADQEFLALYNSNNRDKSSRKLTNNKNSVDDSNSSEVQPKNGMLKFKHYNYKQHLNENLKECGDSRAKLTNISRPKKSLNYKETQEILIKHSLSQIFTEAENSLNERNKDLTKSIFPSNDYVNLNCGINISNFEHFYDTKRLLENNYIDNHSDHNKTKYFQGDYSTITNYLPANLPYYSNNMIDFESKYLGSELLKQKNIRSNLSFAQQLSNANIYTHDLGIYSQKNIKVALPKKNTVYECNLVNITKDNNSGGSNNNAFSCKDFLDIRHPLNTSINADTDINKTRANNQTLIKNLERIQSNQDKLNTFEGLQCDMSFKSGGVDFIDTNISENKAIESSSENLYLPKQVRGVGKNKEARCEFCALEGKERWLKTKCSAYWYHMNYFHGISSISGQPYDKPLLYRIKANKVAKKRLKTDTNDNTKNSENKEYYMKQTRQALCGFCCEWVNIESERNSPVNVPEIYWWKHAQKCHRTNVKKMRNTI